MNPVVETTVPAGCDAREPESLDERLDRLFGPSDPATDAWIAASIAQHDAKVIVLGGAR